MSTTKGRRRASVATLAKALGCGPGELGDLTQSQVLFVGLASGDRGDDPLFALLTALRAEVAALHFVIEGNDELLPLAPAIDALVRRLAVAEELRLRELADVRAHVDDQA